MLNWPDNGDFKCTRADSIFGTDCTIKCHDGYTIDGARQTISCNDQGQWSMQTEDCARLYISKRVIKNIITTPNVYKSKARVVLGLV